MTEFIIMLCVPNADNVQQRRVARDGGQRHRRHRLPRQVAQLHTQAQGEQGSLQSVIGSFIL